MVNEPGLEGRYKVERVNDTEGQHGGCRYFVLDPLHDPIAREALALYATRTPNVALRRDLHEWLDGLAVSQTATGEREGDHSGEATGVPVVTGTGPTTAGPSSDTPTPRTSPVAPAQESAIDERVALPKWTVIVAQEFQRELVVEATSKSNAYKLSILQLMEQMGVEDPSVVSFKDLGLVGQWRIRRAGIRRTA